MKTLTLGETGDVLSIMGGWLCQELAYVTLRCAAFCCFALRVCLRCVALRVYACIQASERACGRACWCKCMCQIERMQQ